MHTFGKNLKFNPHLHLILGNKISFEHKFNRLWKRQSLNRLNIPILDNYSYGFYVWSSSTISSKMLPKYVARYVRHPAIANGRIIKYDKRSITFFYRDNHKNKIIVKKSVFDFIGSLIQHIPPKQFKMIRHYGAYSRNQKRKHLHYFKQP